MVDAGLIGTGGGMPMPNRFLSSLLINYKGRKILIDCGEGTQVSMRILGWGFKSLDIICITHFHGDHTVGLPGLLATLGNSGRLEPLTIIGPVGITDVIKGLRVIVPYLPYELNIIEGTNEAIEFQFDAKGLKVVSSNGDITINTIELNHSTPCIGYNFNIKRSPKFDIIKAEKNNVPKSLWNSLQKGISLDYEGKLYNPEMVLGMERKGIKISYITDTRPIETIPKFIEGSDLFICEGTLGDDSLFERVEKNFHMTFREAANLAKEGKVKELLLTHFSPAMPEPDEFVGNAIEVFKNTVIGKDRMVKTLSFE